MNHIIYVLDSLRADHLGSYGYDRETTPNIDKVARDGLLFQNAYSQAIWTGPSSASILTGHYPHTHGNFGGGTMPDFAPEIAKPLSDTHTTACFSGTAVLKQERFPEFNIFERLCDNETQGRKNFAKLEMDSILELLDDIHSPYVMVVWSLSTHYPFNSPQNEFTDASYDIGPELSEIDSADETKADQVRDHYDNALHYADQQLGRLVKKLKQRGEYTNTGIYITSDHGEVFDEHARWEYTNSHVRWIIEKILSDSYKKKHTMFEPQGFYGHQGCLPYDELLQVPLIIKFPGEKQSGIIENSIVETIDIYETILEIEGIDDYSSQGTSLGPNGDIEKHLTFSLSNIPGTNMYSCSVRDGKYKLMWWENKGGHIFDQIKLSKQNIGYQIATKFHPDKVLVDVEDENEKINNSRKQQSLYEAYCEIPNRGNIDRQDYNTNFNEIEDDLKQLGYLE
jgi:arylsulfatase A-like enzyme